MATSMPTTDDQSILAHVRTIGSIGADVQIVTTEPVRPQGSVTRRVVIEWLTHSEGARVVGGKA